MRLHGASYEPYATVQCWPNSNNTFRNSESAREIFVSPPSRAAAVGLLSPTDAMPRIFMLQAFPFLIATSPVPRSCGSVTTEITDRPTFYDAPVVLQPLRNGIVMSYRLKTFQQPTFS